MPAAEPVTEPTGEAQRFAPHRSWWARRSLRARLMTAAIVIITAAMVLAGALLVWRLHRTLITGLDTTIAQQAQVVASEAKHGHLPRELPESDETEPRVQVVDDDGRIVSASTNLLKDHPWFTAHGGDDDPRVRTLYRRQNHIQYRVAALRADSPSGQVTVYAALPTDPANDSVEALAKELAVGLPIVILVLGVIGWLLLGRALRPVEELRRQAAAIPGTDLKRRLNVPPSRDELGRLAVTLNHLLDRIETSTDRQRQFVADAAHELRSPVAALRTQLEVAQRHPEPESTTALLPGLLDDTGRLGHLVDDLLALARLDATPALRQDTVDLDDIVLQEVRRAHRGQVTVDAAGLSAGRVLGDSSALTRVVRNLLDNAVRHATSRVDVRMRTAGAQVVLVVADDGDGIPAADRDRVFQRFIRLDDARSRDVGGAGLGLAIVRDVVTRHGGTISLEDNKPGARFTVTLPSASP